MLAISRFLSVVLHPIFMPLYTVALLFGMDPRMAYFLPGELQLITLGLIALMTIAFPLTSTLLLLRSGLVSSLEMPTARERIVPFTTTLVYYGSTWYLLGRLPLHPAIGRLFLGVSVALLITLLITLRWKISAHLVGIGGMLGAFVALGHPFAPSLFPLTALVVVVAGALGTARSIAGQHTRAQVYAGGLVGFVSVFAAMAL